MKQKLLILTISLILANTVFAGGPWTKPQGTYYFKLSEWWTIFDQHYTDNGQIDPNVTTGVFNTSIYLEYGLTDRFTGIVNAPLFSRNFMNNIRSATNESIIESGDAINSLGDIDLTLKYSLTRPGTRIPIALSIGLGLPTGKVAGGRQENLQTGDGEFNQFLQLDAGTGFKITKNIPGYFSTYIGFNNRTNGFSDEFRYGFELGAGVFNNKLWISSRVTAVESFKNGETAETITSTSIFANNTEFLSVGIEASYYVTSKFGISAGIASAVRGEIIAAAPSYSVGIFYDFR